MQQSLKFWEAQILLVLWQQSNVMALSWHCCILDFEELKEFQWLLFRPMTTKIEGFQPSPFHYRTFWVVVRYYIHWSNFNPCMEYLASGSDVLIVARVLSHKNAARRVLLSATTVPLSWYKFYVSCWLHRWSAILIDLVMFYFIHCLKSLLRVNWFLKCYC